MKKQLALLLFVLTATLNAQNQKEIVTSTVTYQEIKDQVFYLSDDKLLGRDTGSEGIAMAADYIIKHLEKYGATPAPGSNSFLQEVPLIRVSNAPNKDISVGNYQTNKVLNLTNHEITKETKALFLGYGTLEDFNNHNVEGKYVLLKAGYKDSNNPMALFNAIEEKMNRAAEAGAKGIIEMANLNPMVWSFIETSYQGEQRVILDTKDQEHEFQLIWLLDENNSQANEFSIGETVSVSFEFSGGERTPFVCHNIVAYIEGYDPKLKNEYLIYGAHYDHVGVGVPDATGDSIYNGARDNAVGVVTLLQLAKNLNYKPTKRSGLFVFFTGEEVGLLGSSYYVKNPLLPLENVVFMINSDNAGYNNTSLITLFGLYRTNMSDYFKTAAHAFGLTAIDDPAPEQNLFERSDNVNFAKKGIPSPTFSMGFDSFSGQLLETYHQPSDVAETIDYDYLFKFNKAYVLASRLVANTSTRPFWTPGDKFEEAANKLYKN